MRIIVRGKNLECVMGGNHNVVFGGEINIFPSDSLAINQRYKRPRETMKIVSPIDIAEKIAIKDLSSLSEYNVNLLEGVIVSKIRRVEISTPCRKNEDWVDTRVQYYAVVQGYGPKPES